MIVYKITNKINGKVYIGQTRQSLLRRCRQHCSKNNNVRLLSRALHKYGENAFTAVELGTYSNQIDLDAAEQYYIEWYNCQSPEGYNLTSGGEGAYTRSEETRHLLSEAIKQLPPMTHTSESRLKCSLTKRGALNPMFGKKQSEETRAKRSAALKGRPRSLEVRAKISAGHKRRLYRETA